MLEDLDIKDKKILCQLDLNARQSNAEIAKKVRLSKDVVGYRIKNLEEKEIIRGYNTIIDSSRLGFLFYRVYFNLLDTTPDKIQQLIDFLKKAKNVWWIAELDGAWNFIFAIWVKSNKEFQDFYNKLCLKFRKNIKEHLICPMISFKNVNRRYILESDKQLKITSVGENEKEDLDKIDLEILKMLSKNARISLIEIAEKVNRDSMAIYHRIKKMENSGVIQGYRSDLNFSILKRDFYSVKINLKDISNKQEIINYILKIPELTSMTEAIGSYDIEFDLEVENSSQYFKIIEGLQSKFDSIREIIYFRVLKNYKILYMPE